MENQRTCIESVEEMQTALGVFLPITTPGARVRDAPETAQNRLTPSGTIFRKTQTKGEIGTQTTVNEL
ncbi:MAG: hypothetical protein RIE06_33730 [Roseibium album]|uniref:hypothetical protein n=1 Tax=Roseibium album TaxID=311410 RepID=UPI0032F07A6D